MIFASVVIQCCIYWWWFIDRTLTRSVSVSCLWWTWRAVRGPTGQRMLGTVSKRLVSEYWVNWISGERLNFCNYSHCNISIKLISFYWSYKQKNVMLWWWLKEIWIKIGMNKNWQIFEFSQSGPTQFIMICVYKEEHCKFWWQYKWKSLYR